MSDHVEVDCITCGGPICLPNSRYEYLNRTKKTFYCSAGHAQHFLGEEITQKLVDNLRRSLRQTSDRWQAEYERVLELRGCPFGCGWRMHGATQKPESMRAAIAGHLVDVHHARAGRLLEITEKSGSAR